MKVFRQTAIVLGSLAVITFCAASSYADYKFDDLYGSSGKSYQWMILNSTGDTFGDTHTTAMDISGDLINSTSLNVINGKSETEISDRTLDTIFIVAANGQSDLTMNFRSLVLNQTEIAVPYLELSTPWDQYATQRDLYTAQRHLQDPPSGYDALWRSYNFQIARANTSVFDSVAQYFYFQQNPTDTPSQGIPRPMVIANVAAEPEDIGYETLKVRAILRDASGNSGNIVADNQFIWNMSGPHTAGGDQWVFVPVDDLNTDNTRINYYLTTEVINRCGLRYAAYNGTSNTQIYPSYWHFNIARYHDSPYIRPSFQLHRDSHIAPGLVTVYRRQYDVNETDKIPFRLYVIDNPSSPGVFPLTLNHRILFGKRLGDTYKLQASEGNFNQLEITAFQPRTETGSVFYDNVARVTGSTRTVSVPTNNLFTGSSIKRENMPNSAIQYFTIDQTIPGNIRTSSTEGLLPLHITFNIPSTTIGADIWDNLVKELHRSDDGANLAETFADHFHIYLMATTSTGQLNPWDLTQQLEGSSVRDAYINQIKVFLDEQRGRRTKDTYEGVITVSFIVMLMDGTRDNQRPELSLVSDVSPASQNEQNYIVIRDGVFDNKWNMTFCIAPSEYFDNTDTQTVVVPTNSGSSGGGGGCNGAIFGLISGLIVFAFTSYRKGR